MKNLTEEQIDVLFLYYLMKPEDKELKEIYRQNNKAEQIENDVPVDLFKAQGFTDEQIEQIKKDVVTGAMK
jgi:hypothetical protein